MITIRANLKNNILEFIKSYEWYRFVIIDSCNEWIFQSQGEICDGSVLFMFDWNLPSGVYKVSIYGLDTEDQEVGEFIRNEQLKVINPEGFDYGDGTLADEFNYPLTDENDNNFNMKNKLYRKPLVTDINDLDKLSVGVRGETECDYKVRTIFFKDFKKKFDNGFIYITYEDAYLLMISTEIQDGEIIPGLLKSGRYYYIVDATSASIPLIVQAIAPNAFHIEAKSPDYPQDVIEYNFDSNMIEWRWDTVVDVSVAQDLRNLVDLTIGENVKCTHIGRNHRGSIGNDCFGLEIGSMSVMSSNDTLVIPVNTRGVKVGNDSVLIMNTMASGNSNITLGDNASIYGGNPNTVTVGSGSNLDLTDGDGAEFVIIESGASITMQNGGSLSQVTVRSGNSQVFDSTVLELDVKTNADLSSATYVYSESGYKTMFRGGDGNVYLRFVNSSGVEQLVDATS